MFLRDKFAVRLLGVMRHFPSSLRTIAKFFILSSAILSALPNTSNATSQNRLQGQAATTLANTAPIVFSTGVLMATPEAGAIEFDGTFLYYTNESNSRKKLGATTGVLTGSRAVVTDSSGNLAVSGATSTELGYLAGVGITNGGIVYGNGGAIATTSGGTSGQVLSSNAEGIPSWITPTDAGSASSLVKRDATGNFTAGTILATLTGHATLDLALSGGTTTGTITSRASTTIAGTVPIKFPTGVLMATPEAGAIEFDGTNLYYTNESNARAVLGAGAGSSTISASRAAVSDGSGNIIASTTTSTEISYLSGVGKTNGGIIYGNGGALQVTAAGTSGQVFTSSGTGIPSWTTATDAGSASLIVKRDATGNFTAGTITATLTGSASLDLLLTGGTMTGTITANNSTTIAGTSPIKLQKGVLMATAEGGAIEYNGTSLFYTDEGNTRRALAASASVLTASKALASDSNGFLAVSTSTDTELGYLAGVTFTNGGVIYGNGGKLANSGAGTSGQVLSSLGVGIPTWTTPTSAGGASTIVMRDATGNFTAGTILATLTGTASLDLPLSGGTMTGTITTRASTTIAGTSPIKIQTGVLMATPEATAVEFDGTNLWYTNASNSRKIANTQWTTTASNIYFSGGNVGMGNTAPNTALLHIASGLQTTAANGLMFGSDAAANLYRSAASIVKTDGSMAVVGEMTVTGYIKAASLKYVSTTGGANADCGAGYYAIAGSSSCDTDEEPLKGNCPVTTFNGSSCYALGVGATRYWWFACSGSTNTMSLTCVGQ